MDKNKLKTEWLKSEQKQKDFIGWDFSYIEDRYWQENTSWDYTEIVKNYLKPSMTLLDMGTGGGELLATFQHPYDKTSVT